MSTKRIRASLSACRRARADLEHERRLGFNEGVRQQCKAQEAVRLPVRLDHALHPEHPTVMLQVAAPVVMSLSSPLQFYSEVRTFFFERRRAAWEDAVTGLRVEWDQWQPSHAHAFKLVMPEQTLDALEWLILHRFNVVGEMIYRGPRCAWLAIARTHGYGE